MLFLYFSNQIIHPLLKIHSQSVYQKSLCRLLELETLPMLFLFQQQQKKNIEKVIFISYKILFLILSYKKKRLWNLKKN